MPAFKTPEIPAVISVSSWDKKRELLSKRKPSGVTEAIKTFLDAYKKTDWKTLEDYAKYKPANLHMLFGGAGKNIATEVKKTIADIKAQKNTIGASYVKLRAATLNLNKTAKTAAAMFKTEKYPKASAAALEIAAEAMFFAGVVNPVSLGAFFDACLANLATNINNTLRMLADATDSLQSIVTEQTGILRKIVQIPSLLERAQAYNALQPDEVARRTITALRLRVATAESLDPGMYPVAKAKSVMAGLAPYADGRKKESDQTITPTITTILKLYVQAQALPNYLDNFTAS